MMNHDRLGDEWQVVQRGKAALHPVGKAVLDIDMQLAPAVSFVRLQCRIEFPP